MSPFSPLKTGCHPRGRREGVGECVKGVENRHEEARNAQEEEEDLRKYDFQKYRALLTLRVVDVNITTKSWETSKSQL